MSITLERIFALVKESGKSEYAIKKETGLKNSTFSEWKAGRANPSTDAITTLAQYFNVSADYLLGLSDDLTPIKKPSLLERLENNVISVEDIKALLAENNGVDFIEKLYKELQQKQQLFVLIWLIEYMVSEGLPVKQILGI